MDEWKVEGRIEKRGYWRTGRRIKTKKWKGKQSRGREERGKEKIRIN